MKTITIPENISIKDQNDNFALDSSGKPASVSFASFVSNTLLVDAKFGKTLADILNAVSIKTKLTLAKETLELENDEWEKLYEVAKEPTNGYNPLIVMQLVPFLTAIRDAK